jgi:3-oxoadipate enol-lactonase/4-carboxymuconolactone decarboxylase
MDGTGRLFYRQVPLLARRFRVATYALRDDAPDMQTLIEDLAGVVRVLAGEGRVTVVGESFGGALAMSYALARPGAVQSLVVINSFPFFAPQLRLRLAIAGVRLMPWGAMSLIRAGTAARMHSRYTHRSEIRRFLRETRVTTRRGYLGRLRILTSYDVRQELHRIGVPTLYIAADRDHLVPSVQQSEFMAARVPGAQVHVLAGHGHICLIAPNVDLERILGEWEGEEA